MFLHAILFELFILILSILPILLFSFWGKASEVDLSLNSGIYVYLLVNTLFYFLSFWLNLVDRKKVYYAIIQPVTRRIRLIWAFYLCFVGFILFWGVHWFPTYEFQRLLGIGISLFFFASSNFRLNLHPSSAFAVGLGVSSSANVRETAKMQHRSVAYLFFYIGILMTVLFFLLPSISLVWGNVFLGLSVFYGVVLRLFKTAIQG